MELQPVAEGESPRSRRSTLPGSIALAAVSILAGTAVARLLPGFGPAAAGIWLLFAMAVLAGVAKSGTG